MTTPIKGPERCLATAGGAILLLSVLLALVLSGVIAEGVMTAGWMGEPASPLSLLSWLTFVSVCCLVGSAATGLVRLLRGGLMLGVRDVADADRGAMSEPQRRAHTRMAVAVRLIDGATASIVLGFCILLVATHLHDASLHDAHLTRLLVPLSAFFLLIWVATNGVVLARAEHGRFGKVLAFDLLAQRDERLRSRGWLSRHPRRRIARKIEHLLSL